MKTRLLTMALALVFLTGCASILEREYSTVEPHSSKFWESEAADTLRAENYQDLVNDLLILIGQHKESATVRLYNQEDDLAVTDTVEQAAAEVLQETPLGAYAVEYITSSFQPQRGYSEITIQIGYRRTAEQIQSVVNATSTEAIYSLLESSLNAGRTELAVRLSYWGVGSRETINRAIVRLREDYNLTETPEWQVYYYPAGTAVGLVEVLLEPQEGEEPSEMEETMEEGIEGEVSAEVGDEIADGEEVVSEEMPTEVEEPLAEPAEKEN